MNFDLLIFDCDGTLVDSEPMQNLACSQLLAEEGVPQYTPEVVAERFIGIRLKDMLKTINAETGHEFPPDMSERYVRLVTALTPTHLKEIPNVLDFVDEASRRMKICVASNGQRDNVMLALKRTGLKKYFPDDHIITGIQVKNPKPAPDIFWMAADRMGVPYDRCLVLEELIPGVTGAKAAGMQVFGFTGTHHSQESAAASLKLGADQIFGSFIHIRKHLFG